MSYPEATPHSLPERLHENLFVVYGCIKPSTMVRFTRNMAVVRANDELTLINTVRMDEAGLRALDALGTVKHVLRLGPFHAQYVGPTGSECASLAQQVYDPATVVASTGKTAISEPCIRSGYRSTEKKYWNLRGIG